MGDVHGDEAGTVWDLVVVGGGTAGLVAAKTAARLGARTLLVERDRTGGDCLWSGCVPSKSLLAAAHAAAGAREAARLGVHVEGVKVDFAHVMAHVHGAIAAIEPVDSPASIEATGAVVRRGTARFTGPDSLEIDGDAVHFLRAVIATGAAPTVPDIPGLAGAGPLTNESVWDLTDLPARLAVLGGGSIGCELGQAFARLGSSVTIVEQGPRLLPREDADAAAAVQRALEADGARVVLGRGVLQVEPTAGAQRLRLDDGSTIEVDRILVATGRRPRTADLGLAAAGVEVRDDGTVVVDDHLRTTNHRIWAAGDLTGHPQFTHVAGSHGSLAASNAVLGVRRSVDPVVPRVAYSRPEVAAVGVATGAPPPGVRVVTLPHEDVDRAVAEGTTDGFTRLALDGRGRVVGATVVGPRAGESLGELVLAVKRGLRTRDLAGVVHAYPTWNDGPWNAVLADVREQLEGPLVRRGLGALVQVRRRATRPRRSTPRG